MLEYLIAVFAVNIKIFALDWDLFRELERSTTDMCCQLVYQHCLVNYQNIFQFNNLFMSFLVMETMLSLVLNS